MDNGLILLVEDNERLNNVNARVLALRGYRVVTALTVFEARKKLAQEEPDIILLDIELPDGDGIEFCREIRTQTAAHILFLTAKTENEHIVRGLRFGGDDYITKPFHPKELLARIEAVMRRRAMEKQPPQTLSKGPLTLDLIQTQAFIGEDNLMLTPQEFSLLFLLVQNEGRTLDAEYIYEKAWGFPLTSDKNSLKTAVSRLRAKIEPSGYVIQAVRGQGYVFGKDVF